MRILNVFIGLVMFAVCLFLLASSCTGRGESADHHINLKADDVFSPETKSDPEAEPESRSVEAEYTQIGPVLTNREYVDVGTWTSNGIEADMTLEGVIRHNIWFIETSENGGGDNSPDWKFEFRHNGENVSFVEIEGTESSPDDVVEITALSDLDDPVEAKAGDTFGIYIQYRGWEDIDVYYDCLDYDSGSLARSDSLHIFEMSACENEIVVEVYDVFDSDWQEIGNFIEIDIEGNPAVIEDLSTKNGDIHEINGTEVTGTKITLTVDINCSGGDEIEAAVRYSPDYGDVRETCTADGEKENEKPVASIKSIKPNPAYQGETVTFDASGSRDDDGTIETYLWESNLDDELYRGPESSFAKDDLSPGDHTITLMVKDDKGLWSDEASADLSIRENSPPEITLESPDDGTMISDSEVTLSWTGEDEDEDELSYDVYFGKDEDPVTVISQGQDEEQYLVQDLEEGYTYYWKVVVSDGKSDTESLVWSFMVEDIQENNPPGIVLKYPPDRLTVRSTSVNLIWMGNDDDGDDLNYHVYLAADPSALVMVAENITASVYTADQLELGKTYYWKVVATDGKDETESPVWSFSVESREDTSGDDDDDEWYQKIADEPLYIGGLAAVIAVILILVFMVFLRRDDYEDEDDWEW